VIESEIVKDFELINVMKKSLLTFVALYVCLVAGAQPISLYRDNPHYFLYKGKPTVLITSAEHYGAVINSTPDYKKYLDVLQRHHFNLTRIFVGSYCEGNESENMPDRRLKWEEDQNTLSVRPGKLLTPWARSDVQGYVNGGNKFNLDQWNNQYFVRLKDFCKEASKRGIVVELVLFSANYSPFNWMNSPFNRHNNINLTEDIPYNAIYLSANKNLIRYQLAMVKKIVEEVNAFDNVYFEICNEPYWLKGIPEVDPSIHKQQVTPEMYKWQQGIALAVTQTEQHLSKKHLIAQNFANTYMKIENMDSAVSILNFHYAYPPKTVTDNLSLSKPVSFDETDDGLNAAERRKEAWAFMMAGGAVYDNLDWSFANDDMTGMGLNTLGRQRTGIAVWSQLEILQRAMADFDFINAAPLDSTYKIDGMDMYGLGVKGKDYMIYWLKTKETSLATWNCLLPDGKYLLKWMNPSNGEITQRQTIRPKQGHIDIDMPSFDTDQVLRITRLQ
jgi:hypothetical protein